MKRFFGSKLILSLVTLVLLTAAIVVALARPFIHTHAASSTTGALWATGHDADFHCSIHNPQNCHYLQVAVNFVRNGSTLPVLALDHGTQVQIAITNAFGGGAPLVITVDPRSIAFASLPLVDSAGNPLYSAIIVASDITCSGDCDNNTATGVTPDSDAINARAADINVFFEAGGGILALAGALNSSVYYNFLPLSVTGIPVAPSGPFTLTSFGSSLGLTNADVNCSFCLAHNTFQSPAPGSPFQIVDTDNGTGNPVTLVAFPQSRPSPPSPPSPSSTPTPCQIQVQIGPSNAQATGGEASGQANSTAQSNDSTQMRQQGGVRISSSRGNNAATGSNSSATGGNASTQTGPISVVC